MTATSECAGGGVDFDTGGGGGCRRSASYNARPRGLDPRTGVRPISFPTRLPANW